MALSHPLDIEKNLFFHLKTWRKRLGANMYAYPFVISAKKPIYDTKYTSLLLPNDVHQNVVAI